MGRSFFQLVFADGSGASTRRLYHAADEEKHKRVILDSSSRPSPRLRGEGRSASFLPTLHALPFQNVAFDTSHLRAGAAEATVAGRACAAGTAGLAAAAAGHAGIIAASHLAGGTGLAGSRGGARGGAAARLSRTTADHKTRLSAHGRGLARKAGRASGRFSRGWVGTARLAGSPARHAARLSPGGSLADGVRRRAAAVRSARIPEGAAGPTFASRAGRRDGAATPCPRGLACCNTGSILIGDTASAVETEIARAARSSAAAAGDAGARINHARLADGVGGRTGVVRAARSVGATAGAAGTVRTGSASDAARTGCATCDTDTTRAASAVRASVARATNLASPTAGRGQDCVGTGICVRARCISFHTRATIGHGTIRPGVLRADVAVRARGHIRGLRHIALGFRVGVDGVSRRDILVLGRRNVR